MWSWRPDAGAKSWGMEASLRVTVAKEPGHRGEHEVSRKPSRRESRNAPVEPVVLPPCFLLHGTHGCNQHPAFPAPSDIEEGETRRKARTQRAARMHSYPLFESDVGWVERSETHHSTRLLHRDGFRCALPILQVRCLTFESDLSSRRRGLEPDPSYARSARAHPSHSTAAPTGGPPGGRCKNVIVMKAPIQEPIAANST